MNATTGITLGGQTFDGSPDGTPRGSASVESVAQTSGTHAFSMPPVSAALLPVQQAN